MNAVYETRYVSLKNATYLLFDLKNTICQVLNLETRKEKACLEMNLYGLSGANFQCKDAPIKILCRHLNYAKLVRKTLKPYIRTLEVENPFFTEVNDETGEIEPS